MKYLYSLSRGLDVACKGLSRSELRESFNVSYRVFPKTEFTNNSVDAFGEGVARAWYDCNNIATGVEFYHPFCQVDIDGFEVLGASVISAQQFFKNLGSQLNIFEDMTGFGVFEDSVKFFVPDWDEDGDQATIRAVHFSFSG